MQSKQQKLEAVIKKITSLAIEYQLHRLEFAVVDLEGILIALNLKGDYVIDSSGEFYKYRHGGLTRLEVKYELGKDLKQQDESVLDFLLTNL